MKCEACGKESNLMIRGKACCFDCYKPSYSIDPESYEEQLMKTMKDEFIKKHGEELYWKDHFNGMVDRKVIGYYKLDWVNKTVFLKIAKVPEFISLAYSSEKGFYQENDNS